ncbi:hypothetical protein KUCAC02_018260 [Chaenocephalus aceratus]|uniref:Uncharacterized protein n=1 Tax=Chaenocephalus aceratus TaxID=36190 RepID=A0ACB9W987_CHAAC|nr:hypothetical protein KUCAC02_018260 [Chaenocephalus aceratus]
MENNKVMFILGGAETSILYSIFEAVQQTGESARSGQRCPAKWRKSNTERQYTGRHEREAMLCGDHVKTLRLRPTVSSHSGCSECSMTPRPLSHDSSLVSRITRCLSCVEHISVYAGQPHLSRRIYVTLFTGHDTVSRLAVAPAPPNSPS